MLSQYDDDCPITEEEMKQLTETISTQDITTAANTINEYLKQQERVQLNIGVTGESGSGKSKFVNAFRGLGDEEEGSAKTGVVETTMQPEVYCHPKYKNVKLWDLPGIGTPNFKAQDYLKQVEFDRYDFFIIIASDRFRECHTQLASEIMKMGKKFYFVRSKIDVAIDGEKKKKSFDKKKILDTIRKDCENGLRSIGLVDPVVFLISSSELGSFDFDLLHERIAKELPQHKRHVLLLSVPNITLEINERKKKALKKRIQMVAFASACVAALPVPGLSIAVDLTIIVNEIRTYCNAFGLDEKSLQNLCERSGKSIETLNSLMTSVLHKGLCTGSVLPMLSVASFLVTEEVVESVLAFIPILGSVVAGGLSYLTVSMMLKRALNDIAEDARKVLMAVLETDLEKSN
ncbi:interferon-inducible GTPase 5-like [Xyrauchen texanus]|uniref:interferon-inducible GTPase 5-like n=1 Tax=Xyrauchen texanus TaxID=154827 RepID=UPI002242394E|nr:interferon-inducible GTPase 5-like [Xyrauchen texanus]XP_051958430.1 interferon-inducible GTPase 5-like [Xyrauchen texanus]XP_051958509.1 interferon-inducible GTPase 5-like [Xyrauchen texanus]